MKWSIKIARVAGIDVRLHVTFLIFLAVLSGMGAWEGGGLAAGIESLLFVSAVFGCVLLHEFGHALAARRYGVPTRDITLLPIGGVARLERLPDRPFQELVVALAGPAVNVLIAILLVGWLVLTRHALPGMPVRFLGGSMVEQLLLVNVVLPVFNLVPAFPMDGGRVLRALLALRLEYVRATRIAARVGKVVAVGFGALGVWGLLGGPPNPMLLVIAVFVWVGGNQEVRGAELRARAGAGPGWGRLWSVRARAGSRDPDGTCVPLPPVLSSAVGVAVDGRRIRAISWAGVVRLDLSPAVIPGRGPGVGLPPVLPG